MQRAKSFCFKPIIFVWSVTGTQRRSCACEISFNHTCLHGNGYWLTGIATQLCRCCAAEKNISHFPPVLSEETTITRWKPDFLKLKLYNKVWASAEHEFHQRDRSMQRWGYQNRIRYQTVSYEAEKMRFPVVHMPKHCAQDLKWAEWIITCIHALAQSNAVQNSQLGITSKASMWSSSLQT